MRERLVWSLAGLALSCAIAVAPVLLIHKSFNHLGDHWQEIAFYALCTIGGGISGACGFNLRGGANEVKQQRWMVWGTAAFFFLYIACCALCRKIHFGDLDGEWWRIAGLFLFISGYAVRIWAIAALGKFHSGFVTIQPEHEIVRIGPYKWLRHPSYLGGFIALAGIPFIFGCWFPLLALPGAFVALQWRIDDEERLLSQQFGEQFDQYKADTWRLIPRIY
jgi:protein-S-isoprenylcysteine O-methyltransferase Ste14